jgi:hypothetical protein
MCVSHEPFRPTACWQTVTTNQRVNVTNRRGTVPINEIATDSAETYENPARGTACRKTCEFPVRAKASLIGRLMTITENAWLFAKDVEVLGLAFGLPLTASECPN